MLSYQHSYHAGCFADVMKHALLTRILHYLIQKDKPLLYLDTHSGRGVYDLTNEHARKTNEAAFGIQPVWEKRTLLSPLFSPYIEIINQLNLNKDTHRVRYYPGSCEIAIQLLRSQDRLVFCELHPTEFSYLQKLSRKNKRIFFKKEDGLKNLKALLPAIERRGLVFIDPSYERKTEYQEVVQAIHSAYNLAPTMTYCLWYPWINHQLPPQFLDTLKAIAPNNSLRLEFYSKQPADKGMTGSGLYIINPPYILIEEAKEILKGLSEILKPNEASYLVD